MTSRTLLLAALVAVGAVAVSAQAPTFRSSVDVVRVDVVAVDNGKPIDGLTADDFEVLDSNVAQHVDLRSRTTLSVNVVIALDMSDSVSDETFRALRDGCEAVIAALAPAEQARLVTFDSVATVRAPLTHGGPRFSKSWCAPPPWGRRKSWTQPMPRSRPRRPRPGRALVVLFTDGLDTSSVLRPDSVLGIAKRADVVVYGGNAGGRRRQGLSGRRHEADSGRNRWRSRSGKCAL
jgi:hypothetical protein